MIGFIGREEELSTIERIVDEFICVQQSDESVPAPIIYLVGEGGVGKTRLLQELPQKLNIYSSLEVVDICDFDDRSLFVEDNLELWLLSKLNPDRAQRVRDEFRIFQAMKDRGDSSMTLSIQRQRINSELLIAYEASLHLLRFDTVEKLSFELRKKLVAFISQLKNTVVIVAGRPGENLQFERELEQLVTPNKFFPLRLEPFRISVGKEYIHRMEEDRKLKVPNKIISPLLKLTGGKPILIDLAIEYVVRSVSIDPLLAISESEFDQLGEETQQEKRDKFEENLVAHILQLSDRMDRLILMLSRVYPLTATRIADLLNLTQQEAHTLFIKAQSYAFIKTLPQRSVLVDELGADELRGESISLQDVMRDLINYYVWDKVDPNKYRRKRDSALITKIYRQIDRQLHELYKSSKAQIERAGGAGTWEDFVHLRALEKEREIVTETWVEHALYADIESGLSEWRYLIDRVRRGRKYELAYRLFELAKPYYEAGNFSLKQTGNYLFVKARAEMDKSNYGEARNVFLNLLQSEDLPIEQYEIYNMLGVTYRNLGRFQQALDYQQRCLELLTPDMWWDRANVENQTGNLYRLLEDFNRENLTLAKHHFNNVRHLCTANNKEARELGLEKSNKILLGSACNNLGYVEGLQGNHARAYQLLELSVEIFQAAERGREISWPETHMGILARDEGRFDYSGRLLNRAINRLSLPDDHKELCRAYFHLGWTQWFKAFEVRDNIDVESLEIARNYLEKSHEIANEFSYLQEQPGIYHQFATVTWLIGHFRSRSDQIKEGRRLNQISLSLCHELNNIRYGIDALVGEMEFDLVDFPGDCGRLKQTYERLRMEYGDYDFPLYFGRAHRILGDCAFHNQKFSRALKEYQIGIPLMNYHGGYGPYSIDTELDKLGERIQKLPVELAKEWIHSLARVWQHNRSGGYADLMDWCDAQTMRNQLR